MGLIHVLDTEVSNKIAAGEVVERPQSIVKELVENSIDAGAALITVEIKNGGISYIRVTDNGAGMSAEDAKVCFLRHATSKIATGADLEEIYTLGFRGEALSSIGAVAKVRLYTKRREDESGVCVTCEGGEILSSADAGAPNGTVMEVCDLFYNTPARLKFLKKPATEAGYIQDIVSRFVLAHPEISFKLIRDGKEIIFSPGDNKLLNAVYAVYGRDYAKNMLDVDLEYNGIRVSGVIGKGTLTRANRNYENFFVNRRYVKSAIMIRALEEAYKNQIMISKFPTAALNIDISPRLVDINVHPTKLECQFSNEQEIYQAVYHAAKKALYAKPNVPEIEREKPMPASPQGKQRTLEELFREKVRASSERAAEQPKFKTEARETPLEFKNNKSEPAVIPPREKTAAIPAESDRAEGYEPKPAYEPKSIENAESKQISEAEREEQWIRAELAKGEESNKFAMIEYALERAKRKKKSRSVRVEEPDYEAEQYYVGETASADGDIIFDDGYFRVVGQLFDTYIIVEKDDRMLIIDQHAAHERLNYEMLKKELENGSVMSQMIMEPIEVRLDSIGTEVYEANAKLFSELGYETEMGTVNTVSITAVPGDISWSEAEPLFLELLEAMAEMKNDVIAKTKERLLYTISCKAAIKANMRISREEMHELVKRVFALKNINTCPHGRPIVIAMTKKEIEKDFKRIV
ncbi:MAG: DNA mismatch repair endonuclease MutL [Clostridia bacterium]|nr:DNA mismatch repair endonuclease MutL [Clostridia bacterium]